MAFATIFSNSCEELDRLYRNASPAPIPEGDTRGMAVAHPGSILSPFEQVFFRAFWAGKVFQRQKNGTSRLVNKTPIGRMIPADVRLGDSLIDDRKTIIIDYSADASIPVVGGLVSRIRDEIRCVAPDLYLGYAFVKKRDGFQHLLYFALDSSKNTIAQPIHSEAAPALLAP